MADVEKIFVLRLNAEDFATVQLGLQTLRIAAAAKIPLDFSPERLMYLKTLESRVASVA